MCQVQRGHQGVIDITDLTWWCDVVYATIPCMRMLNDTSCFPALAKACIRLHYDVCSAAIAVASSEAECHESLLVSLNINRRQYLYSSPCYAGFLQRRFDRMIRQARATPAPQCRGASILLLASATPGEAHASRTSAQTLLGGRKG